MILASWLRIDQNSKIIGDASRRCGLRAAAHPYGRLIHTGGSPPFEEAVRDEP
jgi:hypothetical protein